MATAQKTHHIIGVIICEILEIKVRMKVIWRYILMEIVKHKWSSKNKAEKPNQHQPTKQKNIWKGINKVFMIGIEIKEATQENDLDSMW